MADFDPATGLFVVPWWGAITLAALVVALAVLAVLRAGGARTLTLLAQFAAVAIVVFMGWTFLDRLNHRDLAEERHALAIRISELTSRAMAPGSTLACLDPLVADAIEEGCEKSLFATPESVAGAVTYVTARLALLAEAADFVSRNVGSADHAVINLRRGLEADRFGIVAHVLATRDACTFDHCAAFGLLNDPSIVATNMKEHTFETRVGRNVAAWLARTPPVAASPAVTPPAAAAASSPVQQPAAAASAAAVNFPTASTIPPVSIMNNEPGVTGQNGMDEAKPESKTDAKPTASTRRPAEKPAPKRSQNSAPLQVAPPATQAATRDQ